MQYNDIIMAVTYTIVNICPKKTFTTEEELKKYCRTHIVPDANYAMYPERVNGNFKKNTRNSET